MTPLWGWNKSQSKSIIVSPLRGLKEINTQFRRDGMTIVNGKIKTKSRRDDMIVCQGIDSISFAESVYS